MRPLPILSAAVLALVVLLGWAELSNWREVSRLRTRFREVDLENPAAEFQARLLAPGGGGPALRGWLAALGGEAEPAERELIDEMLKALGKPNVDRGSLLALSEGWKSARQALLEAHIAAAQRSLDMLRDLLLVSFFALVALVAFIAGLVKLGLIAPLRRELVATHALVARHEKLAALGVLAAGVAHEIRNPLTAIKARLYSQGKRLTAGSPEAADAMVIKDEIHRLERIVRDVLEFARPSEPELSPRAARDVLEEAGALMTPILTPRAIALRVEADDNLRVNVDPGQIKQVLINLIQNAADSIGEAGEIVLRARSAVLPLAPHRTEAVALEVSDTGRGVPLEVQARLFDPFFTTKPSGAGLGLAIAERIVEKHGGVLQLQTRPGRGATFSMILPALP